MAIGEEKTQRDALYPLAVIGFLAGAVNGFFGTGAGMILILGLRRFLPEEQDKIMAISTLCVFCFSILTTILYYLNGNITAEALRPILLPSLLGGAIGAFLLGRVPRHLTRLVFAALLLISGIRILLL